MRFIRISSTCVLLCVHHDVMVITSTLPEQISLRLVSKIFFWATTHRNLTPQVTATFSIKPLEQIAEPASSHCCLASLQAAKPRFVVGLDFGTHGTGFAYSLGTPDRSGSSLSPRMLECCVYPDHPIPGYPKTLTAVLYNGRRATDFGYTAQRKWNVLTPSQRTDGSHHFVTGAALKLGLNDAVAAPEALPAGISAVYAAADFLSLFRRYVLAHLGRTAVSLLGIALTSDMIQVCGF